MNNHSTQTIFEVRNQDFLLNKTKQRKTEKGSQFYLPISRTYKRLRTSGLSHDVLMRVIKQRLIEDVKGRPVLMPYIAADNTAVALENDEDLEIARMPLEACRILKIDTRGLLLDNTNQREVSDLPRAQDCSRPIIQPSLPPASVPKPSPVPPSTTERVMSPPRSLPQSPAKPIPAEQCSVEMESVPNLPSRVIGGSTLKFEVSFRNTGNVPLPKDTSVYLSSSTGTARYSAEVLNTATFPSETGKLLVTLEIPEYNETVNILYTYSVRSTPPTSIACRSKDFKLNIDPKSKLVKSIQEPRSDSLPRDKSPVNKVADVALMDNIQVLEMSTGQPEDVCQRIYKKYHNNIDLALEELMRM